MKKKLTLAPGSTATIEPSQADGAVAPAAGGDRQKQLKHLIARRHPLYAAMSTHWEFLAQTYEGGREWFSDKNIFRYIKEGQQEFNERLQRCYRFNHTREVVDLLNKYLFKQNITRSTDAPLSVQEFWKRSTKNGLGIRDFVRQCGRKASIMGRIGVVVDNNAAGAKIVSKADEKKANVRTYAYILTPSQLLDYSWDEDGNLAWVLVREIARDDADPMTSSGNEKPQFRLWTKTDWKLYEERGTNRRVEVVEIGSGEHSLGEVPVILHDHIITDEEYTSPALIDDIAYLDRAVANYLSNLDAIIQDQTYSQLTMPAQNVMPGDDNYNTMLKMGTNRVFLYDGEGTHKPEYIAPDPKQAQMILAMVNKIIGEIYHTVGMAGERTKQDNAMGIDNSSGVAKAYDFERVNALLQAKADSLEVLENKIARLVGKWNGETVTEDYVSYPDNFDTRGLYDEFDIAGRLMLVDAPKLVRQKQMELVIDKLFPQLAKDIREAMIADLENWPVDPVERAAEMAAATAPPEPAKDEAPAKSPAGQGSVQKDTK
jgi:hypothetical protein